MITERTFQRLQETPRIQDTQEYKDAQRITELEAENEKLHYQVDTLLAALQRLTQ